MRPFATYIEYLLMTQHYCYVPSRGAYMLAEEHASTMFDAEAPADKAQLKAPHRVVRFSTLHHHDDGLLCNLLMEAEGMTYDEACRYIERQAPLLSDHFAEQAAVHIDIEHFGFDDLTLESWMAIERKKALAAAALTGDVTQVAPQPQGRPAAAPADTIAIPKYWLRRVAAILLVILCYFANFLGLTDRVAQEQMASVLDVTMFQRSTPTSSWDEMDEEALDAELEGFDAEAVTLSEASDSPETSVLAEASAPSAHDVTVNATAIPDAKMWNESLPMRNMDSQLAMAQSPTGRLYYIIIASCSTESDAQRALGNLHKAGYENVGVLERDGRFRLYVNFFAQKNEADAYISKLRQIERFHDAWMLPVRDGSLSHIIKNTYNDNQLSMELSHLNQRTERDQG